MVCHSRAASFVLGLSTIQMNRDGQLGRTGAPGILQGRCPRTPAPPAGALETPAGGAAPRGRPARLAAGAERPRPADQAREPDDRNPAKAPDQYDRLADPYDASASLDRRARSYLHANCAQCHVEAGGGNSAFDLHIRTKPDRMKLFDVKPQHDTFGVEDPRIVASGSPTARSSSRGHPPRHRPDASARDQRRRRARRGDAAEWIAGLRTP